RSPVVEKISAQRLIQRDGWVIPVQYFPPDESKVFLFRRAGNACKKRFADTAPAKSRTDKKILQKQSSASPGRVEAKEERVANGLSLPFGDHGAKVRIRAEAVARDIGLCCPDLIRLFLIVSKFPDQSSKQRGVGDSGVTNC